MTDILMISKALYSKYFWELFETGKISEKTDLEMNLRAKQMVILKNVEFPDAQISRKET